MEWIIESKTTLVEITGLSQDALHVQIGLLVYFGSCVLFRWKAWHLRVWLLVLVAALLNEASDLYYHYAITERWLLNASEHDMLNTMFAPTLIFIFARWSKIFARNSIEVQAPETEASAPESSDLDSSGPKSSSLESSAPESSAPEILGD